jgi:hypothetical protein
VKTQLIKPAMRAVFDSIAEKQFKEMKKNRSYYDAMICNTPSGKETRYFGPGDYVVSTGTGTYKKGVVMEVLEAYEENGYWKYIVSHGKKNQFRCMQRQIDLVKI